MAWTSPNKSQHLAQLHEESRYYRRFHHTVFSVIMAGYIALIILQANLLTCKADISIGLNSMSAAIVGIAIIVLVIIPCFLTHLFVAYHYKQGNIRDNIHALQKELGFPDRYLEDVKYKDFKDKSKLRKLCIGRGHKIFITTLWLMILANLLAFLILSKVIT